MKKHNPLGTNTSLDTAIQALVKVEINSAMDTARQILEQNNRNDRREDNIKSLIRYSVILIGNIIFGILVWIYGPKEVQAWTKQFVSENMNKPTLQQAAKEVISAKMGSFADDKLRPLATNIRLLQNDLSTADATTKRLQSEQHNIALVYQAENLDKDAFIKLQEIAAGKGAAALQAQITIKRIKRSLMLDKFNVSFMTMVETFGEKEYTGPFTNDEIALFLNSSDPEGAVNIVGHEKRLEFVPCLYIIAHQSKDLWQINRVSKALQNMIGVKFSPTDLKPLDIWWKNNGWSYKEWPHEEYNKAIAAFENHKYNEALPIFEAVIAVDRNADKCRALAIACAIEIGDTAAISRLNNKYSVPDGRWEEFAKCKMLLETGTAQQATEAFVNIAKKYPTFILTAQINPNNYCLRKLHWQLFHELINQNKNIAPIKYSN